MPGIGCFFEGTNPTNLAIIKTASLRVKISFWVNVFKTSISFLSKTTFVVCYLSSLLKIVTGVDFILKVTGNKACL